MPHRLLALILLAPAAHASAAGPPSPYSTAIKPLVAKYCGKCHDAEHAEGGVNFAKFTVDADALNSRKLWKRSAGRIRSDEMPPEDEPAPTKAERDILLAWMGRAADYVPHVDIAKRDPGPGTPRRLTRSEYHRMMKDVFEFPFNVADITGLPADTGDGFDNRASALAIEPGLMGKYLQAADTILDKIYTSDWYGGHVRNKAITVKPNDKLPEDVAARRSIEQLAKKLFRLPPLPETVDRYLAVFVAARPKAASYEAAFRPVLRAMFISPRFLFRLEDDRPAVDANTPGVPVSGPEYAVRLSYFLWAVGPDDELFKLGESGKILEPAVREAQIKRMLASPKARALTEEFAAQWLRLDKLDTARPTTEFFPSFNNRMRDSMRKEVEEFFDYLRTADRPITDLLDADYAFLNGELAKHYKVPGVEGDKFVKVQLPAGSHRGGLLGTGAVLAMTSHTFRTSPTLRGKYVLDVIFGTPPPPPPADAGTLADDKPKKEPKTFKDVLAQHASKVSCAACHAKIDPIGFALDNFNAVGEWRESTPQVPLDTAGTLPGGTKVRGFEELRTVLVGRRDEFARNAAEQMMSYALGRTLEPADEVTLQEIMARWKADGFVFSSLVRRVAASVPFTHRRAKPREE